MSRILDTALLEAYPDRHADCVRNDRCFSCNPVSNPQGRGCECSRQATIAAYMRLLSPVLALLRMLQRRA